MSKPLKDLIIGVLALVIVFVGGRFLDIKQEDAERIATDLAGFIDSAKTSVDEGSTKTQNVLSNYLALKKESDPLKIAAFNIQIFGLKKLADTKILDVLVKVALNFDIIFVEEIRDTSNKTADDYLQKINQAAGEKRYAYVESGRLGRSSSKEQYAYFYNTKKVRLISDQTYPDTKDVFEREPFIATFVSNDFDFTLVGLHSKPTDATAELAALDTVVNYELAKAPNEKDVILLGDFNADGSYFDENDSRNPLKNSRYHWIIDNTFDTMTKTDWTYDRMILLPGTFDHEYQKNTASIFRFDRLFGLDTLFVQKVSDHFPITANFDTQSGDDD
jgi:deoxyribonuclease-1-like protein